MRRHHLLFVFPLALGFFCWGFARTGDQELFNVKKSQQEIEVMRGILRTTLSFAADGLEPPFSERAWKRTAIDGFYLYGQGAVFIISVPGRGSRFDTSQLLFGEALGVGSAVALSPAALLAPGAPASPEGTEEEARDTVRRLQAEVARLGAASREKLEKAREERSERVAAYRERLVKLKDPLIEALASHGDSLMQVKSGEYITFILRPEASGFELLGRNNDLPSEVISAKKSTIADYKAGRLTLEDFKTAVLQYNN